MGNELVKRGDLERRIERWRKGASPVLPTPGTPPLPYAPRQTEARTLWAPPDNLPPLSADAELIALPRICAIHKKLWIALYRRDRRGTHFTYLRSNVGESWHLIRYATPDKWGTTPPNLRSGVELCPHCGAYTMDGYIGSIYCDQDNVPRGCGMYFCFGLTSQHGHGICACGREGQVVMERGSQNGFGLK